MDEKNKSKNENVETVKYSTIKRMLATLDKFLSKKLVLVLGVYSLVMAICGTGLFINNSSRSNAAGNGANAAGITPNPTLNAVLFSIIALLSFLTLLAVLYYMARRRARLSHFADKKPVKDF